MAEIGSLKEEVFLKDLIISLVRDVYEQLSLPEKEARRDISNITNRLSNEGVAFVTKTLPNYWGGMLNALSRGRLLRSDTPGFKKSGRSSAIPLLFKVLVNRVFDADCCPSRTADAASAAKALAQLCTCFKKYELDYSQKQVDAKLTNLMETDSALYSQLPQYETGSWQWYIMENFMMLGEEVLNSFSVQEITPRHGPGAIAYGSIDPHIKYECRGADRELEDYYPESEYCSGSLEDTSSDVVRLLQGVETSSVPTKIGLKRKRYVEKMNIDDRPDLVKRFSRILRYDGPNHYIPLRVSRVCPVPKDSRGPRIISAEEPQLMWYQQGLGRALAKYLESHPLTHGHVNFSDQSINGALALKSSMTGDWATIDLSDASDRVSLALVELLPGHLSGALKAVRSHWTLLPDGTLLELKKYAPMGSACCFPVESLIFWLICTAAIMLNRHTGFKQAAEHIYVYGDDIICPVDDVDAIYSALELVGFKVNETKSFSKGPFRESCGVDAYNGVDITPIKIKKRIPQNRDDATGLIAYTAYGNALNYQGYPRAAALLRDAVEAILGKLPVIPALPKLSTKWAEDEDFIEAPTRYAVSFGGLHWWSHPTLLTTGKIRMEVEKDYTARVKYRGNGFMVLNHKPTCFGGVQVKTWIAKSKSYIPPESEFPDYSAYLRYATLRGQGDTPGRGLGTRFSKRFTTTLCRKWLSLT